MVTAKQKQKAQQVAIFKSWAKTFVAAGLVLYSTGNRDWRAILGAGAAGLLPVVLAWLDPADKRFGRNK